MIRALLAALIIVCPAALGQEYAIRCDKTNCIVPLEALKMLVAQAKMNCGPTR